MLPLPRPRSPTRRRTQELLTRRPAEILTVSEAAAIIGGVTGRPVQHVDIDRETWIEGVLAAGVPAEYGQMLRVLTETVASGAGSTPNDDVERVTGAPPRSFADFARRNATAWMEN